MAGENNPIKIDSNTVRIRVDKPEVVSIPLSEEQQLIADRNRNFPRQDTGLIRAAGAFDSIFGDKDKNPSIPVVITARTEPDRDDVRKQLVFRGATTDVLKDANIKDGTDGLKNVNITEIKFNHEEFKLDKPLKLDVVGGQLTDKSIKTIGALIKDKEVHTGVSVGGFNLMGDTIKMVKANRGSELSLSDQNEKSGIKVAMAQASEVNLANIAKMADGDKSSPSIPRNGGSKNTGIA